MGATVTWLISASLWSRRNLGTCKRERASARQLVCPGICCIKTLMFNRALNKNKCLTSFMIVRLEEVPERQTCVMMRLSVKKRIWLSIHLWPHVKTAATIANNSWTLMRRSLQAGSQGSLNHSSPYTAPNPNPEASVKRRRETDVTGSDWMMATPFHEGRKSSHHCISALASASMVIWWCNADTLVDKSINRRKNIRSGKRQGTNKWKQFTLGVFLPTVPNRKQGGKLLELVLREANNSCFGINLNTQECQSSGRAFCFARS